eukprot:gene14104-30015_t
MKPLRQTALSAMLLLAAGGAFAGVNVSYTQPELFSDVPFAPWERERILKELSRHFAKMGAALPAGQDLNITVTDLDLAGHVWPSMRTGTDLRIVKGGADWPHMTIKYSITQDGQVVRQGEEHLSNMDYLR